MQKIIDTTQLTCADENTSSDEFIDVLLTKLLQERGVQGLNKLAQSYNIAELNVIKDSLFRLVSGGDLLWYVHQT